MGTIIGNKSEGHNYHYANLADIARQGIEIPPMRVAPVFDNEGRLVAEYIEALIPTPDNESPAEERQRNGGMKNAWVRGARIVVPSSTRSNEAQNYGSALTYARRYTVLTLLGIACDDDDKIESHSEADQKSNEERAKEELRDLYEKAGGADFDAWFTKNTSKGFNNTTYAQMKTTLIKQINKKAEEKK